MSIIVLKEHAVEIGLATPIFVGAYYPLIETHLFSIIGKNRVVCNTLGVVQAQYPHLLSGNIGEWY